MRLVLLGPPGAGKGTQARDAVASTSASRRSPPATSCASTCRTGTPLGVEARTYMDRGEYVPDDVVVEMVMRAAARARRARRVHPRRVPAHRAAGRGARRRARPTRARRSTAVLKFAIADEMAIRRLTARWTCPNCKRTYNLEFKPPAKRHRATSAVTRWSSRDDDDELTVRAPARDLPRRRPSRSSAFYARARLAPSRWTPQAPMDRR